MQVFTRKRLAVLAALAVTTGALVPLTGRNGVDAARSATPPASAVQAATQRVTAAQSKLSSYGYVLAITGRIDGRTQLVLRHWQRANSLPVDGALNGPTASSLGLPAVAGPPVPQKPVHEQPGPPAVTPTWHSGDCDSFRYLADRYGLPWSTFRYIMQRESHCDPHAYNGRGRDRSYGLVQINTKGSNWDELRWRCGLTERSQLWDPATNLRCASKLREAYGMAPWGM